LLEHVREYIIGHTEPLFEICVPLWHQRIFDELIMDFREALRGRARRMFRGYASEGMRFSLSFEVK
jgi:hypothetical protein